MSKSSRLIRKKESLNKKVEAFSKFQSLYNTVIKDAYLTLKEDKPTVTRYSLEEVTEVRAKIFFKIGMHRIFKHFK